MISEQEIKTGQKSTLQRDLTEDQIMELKEVQDIVQKRVAQVEELCGMFFKAIIQTMNKLPYGIRWICKSIKNIAQVNWIGIFPYYLSSANINRKTSKG
jgi:Ras GTPase-activating-like protein IQGAP2/3